MGAREDAEIFKILFSGDFRVFSCPPAPRTSQGAQRGGGHGRGRAAEEPHLVLCAAEAAGGRLRARGGWICRRRRGRAQAPEAARTRTAGFSSRKARFFAGELDKRCTRQ